MSAGWYHWTERDGTYEIRHCNSAFGFNPHENWFGPFKTFTAAKLDAIQYHQLNIADAKLAIKQIRTMTKPKKEGQK